MDIISVIVPVYKVEKYIHRCIDSILAQTFSDFELILVDDGSPDNCGIICDEYALKDNRIHVIHKENGGLSDARNAGIDWAFENSDSKWLTFIDSDDWVHPDYLYFLYEATQITGKHLSVCSFSEVNELNCFEKIVPNYYILDTESAFVTKKKNMIVAWGKLFLKTDFFSIRFPVGKLHEDEFTIYKLLFKYKQISYVDASLYYYFFNQNSITNAKWNYRRLDVLEALNQQIDFFLCNNYDKAHAYSGNDLLYALADAIVKLRQYYPYKIILRVKYYAFFIRIKKRFSKKTVEERNRLNKELYPKLYCVRNKLRKKRKYFLELLRSKQS